jgi:hypothetical protein
MRAGWTEWGIKKERPLGRAACASSERCCYSDATATPPVVEVVERVVVVLLAVSVIMESCLGP